MTNEIFGLMQGNKAHFIDALPKISNPRRLEPSRNLQRAASDGLLMKVVFSPLPLKAIDFRDIALRARVMGYGMRKKILCGARTRRGTACQCKAIGTKRGALRCRLHGGLSTGPKTKAGKYRSLLALQDYWAGRLNKIH